jgi:hypothetical protein
MAGLGASDERFVDGETDPIYHQSVHSALRKSLSDWAKVGLRSDSIRTGL